MSEQNNSTGRFATLPPSSYAMVGRLLVDVQNKLLEASVLKREQAKNVIGSMREVNSGIASFIQKSAKHEARKLQYEAGASFFSAAVAGGGAYASASKAKKLEAPLSEAQGKLGGVKTINNALGEPRGAATTQAGEQPPASAPDPQTLSNLKSGNTGLKSGDLGKGNTATESLPNNAEGPNAKLQDTINHVKGDEKLRLDISEKHQRLENTYQNEVSGYQSEITNTTQYVGMVREGASSLGQGTAQLGGSFEVLEKAKYDSSKVVWELTQSFLNDSKSDFSQRAGENTRAGSETLQMLKEIYSNNRAS